MKANTDVQAVQERSKVFVALQAALPFFATTAIGTLISAVAGLFAYSNAMDARSRDGSFLAILIPGILVSVALGFAVARMTVRSDPDSSAGAAMGLLKKYRRGATQPGADREAGQYNIGESYLRALLRRRGA